MAFRGRGRGRGRGGGPGRGGFFERSVTHEPYVLFPEDVKLPGVPNIGSLRNEDTELLVRKLKLDHFWKTSCYNLLESVPKSKKQDAEIERFSDKNKQKTRAKREALADYLKLTPSNFPPELIQGSKRVQHDPKKVRWADSVVPSLIEEKVLDMFEKLEENYKGQDEKGGKEKKGDSEDEEEDVADEVQEESSDDGDYNQNIDFDDDEDDLNKEEGEYEDAYE